MQCICYMITKTKKANGKPFKKGRSRTTQESTIHHTSTVDAKAKGWFRCPGELKVEIRIGGGGCSYCDPGPELDVEFACSVCRFRGGTWTITGNMYDEGNEKFLEDTIIAHYNL